MDESTPDTGCWVETPTVWEHETIPFAQFVSIDLFVNGGTAYRLLSQHEDETDFFGLYLIELADQPKTDVPLGAGYRNRELNELPTGSTKVEVLRRHGEDQIVEFALRMGNKIVRFLSAEVYERGEENFDICELDESILMQLDGQRPNPSIERTPNGTAHGERWAP
ncbi:hypothetical protein ACIGHN_13235 [Acidovorax sp. NPDC077693]|uniref:hypothetical protein n=1 Tax=unclassified Acidovorax TaxID=2684926 RepID=UPI0037C568F3